MPSTRPHGLNPRLAATPAAMPAASPRAEPQAAPIADTSRNLPADEREDDADAEARAGGFHESSYELHHGLQVSESDWPDDVTVPGRLSER